ncbi:hypothetical protein AL387_gp117 [Carp edema virus]|nr:hypothetical protein AL387_gp117 [Carp edema virus]
MKSIYNNLFMIKDNDNKIIMSNFMNFLEFPYRMDKYNIHILTYDYLAKNSKTKSTVKLIDFFKLDKVILINPEMDFLQQCYYELKKPETKIASKVNIKLYAFFIQ